MSQDDHTTEPTDSPAVTDELRARLVTDLASLGVRLVDVRGPGDADPRTIEWAELVEAVLAVCLRLPHRARQATADELALHRGRVLSAEVGAAGIVRAVRVLRLVRAHATDLVDEPRHAPFAQHHVAMLLADELAGMPNLEGSLDDAELAATVDEYSLHDRAWLRLSLVLALAGIVEGRASLRTLEWLFEQPELVEVASTADAEGMRIVDEVSQGLAAVEEVMLGAGLEPPQVVEVLEGIERHGGELRTLITGLVMELGVLPMPTDP